VKTLVFDLMGVAGCLDFFSEFDKDGKEILADIQDLDAFFNK